MWWYLKTIFKRKLADNDLPSFIHFQQKLKETVPERKVNVHKTWRAGGGDMGWESHVKAFPKLFFQPRSLICFSNENAFERSKNIHLVKSD